MTDISIIIPTLNRARALSEALESAARVIDPDDPVEIIITNIRRNGCPPAAPRKTWKDFLRPIKWKFERERILGKPSEGVRRLVAMARIAGVHFHENQV